MLDSTSKQTLRIYWRYVQRYLPLFLIAASGSALAVIVQGLVPPFVVSRIFAKLQLAYSHHETIEFAAYLPYFATYAIAMLLGVILWRGQAFANWRLEEKVQHDLANDIYDHLQSQSERFHADRFGGALVSQTNKFHSSYVRLMDSFIWNIVPITTTVIVAITVLFFVAWQFAVVMLIITVFYLTIMSRQIAHQLPFNVSVAEQESRQTAALADAVTNMATIRAFAGEAYESKRFHKVTGETNRRFRVLTVEVLKTEAISHIQTNGFQILALLVGLVAVTHYGTNVSLLYLAITYVGRIVDQLWQFGRTVREVNRGFGDALEMTKILQVEPSVQDAAVTEPSKIHRGEIVFRNVNFAYPENQQDPLFENLSLRIKPGEKVGLVGQSGGGKTTITRLLLRFADITNGEILIDGQNIAQLKQHDLRTKITFVSQEPILFHRTLAENIGYSDQTASQHMIEAVAKMAHADEFIERLPHGYDTLVGERGVKLSGGQRQRVAIARAMLKNAPILVLDEATSALDSESEVLIQDALWKLMEGKTAIVIAHRLSTIQKMDRIIVLDDGKITEEGSHKQLLAQKNTYAKLWTHQSGGFIDE